MTLAEFRRQVYAVAATSPICGVPLVRRLTSTSINLRVDILTGDFIDAFYNEQTDTVAYAVIRDGKRVFGADNTGGWHIHSWDRPMSHTNLPGPWQFVEFIEAVEKQVLAELRLYTDEELRQFLSEDRIDPESAAMVRRLLAAGEQ